MISNNEWLETNGLGSYASSTPCGMNTRRYHGLLVAAPDRLSPRCVLLSKVEEDLIIDGQCFSFSTNQYDNALHSQGYQYLKDFTADPFPIFIYDVNGVILQKTVFLVYGQNTVVIEYMILKDDAKQRNIRLELRPLTAFREYHALTFENNGLDQGYRSTAGKIIFQPYSSLPPLFFAHNAVQVKPQENWYKNFFYQQEADRGLGSKEDLFNPFLLTFDLNASHNALLMASLEDQDTVLAEHLKEIEVHRRADLTLSILSVDNLKHQLIKAADQFIVKKDADQTVIAGYHWFEDWGRDTMIALPGLMLSTGRYQKAENILIKFASLVDQGMLPNRYVEAGQIPEYNTVDAALWFVEAVRQYGEGTKKWGFVNENFFPVLKDIIGWYIQGARYNIHMDTDALISCGQEGVQLTWMDAKVGDWVVTPRRGKPVEIQALWFNALCIMHDLADRFGDEKSAARYAALIECVKISFNALFWNHAQGGLYDVINGDQRDDAIRPNQLFAISLHYPVLHEDKWRQVVDLAGRELLTPFGLRTLSPNSSGYKGVYAGDPSQRDAAYHQGTVWPWLIGPYIFAYLKTTGKDPQTLANVKGMLLPFEEHLNAAGLGQISEIFDGDAPHAPRGCIAQAWSVAELLRVLEIL